jgi:hypothetical protein
MTHNATRNVGGVQSVGLFTPHLISNDKNKRRPG